MEYPDSADVNVCTFLPSSIAVMVCLSRYLNSVVNSDFVLEDGCDSDGEVIGQECTIFAVFEFINVLGESDAFQGLLLPILPQLMYFLLVYMQITQEQVRVNCREL